MKNPVKLYISKPYVIVDYINNHFIAFTDTKEEANRYTTINENYVIYEITNEIICNLTY